MSGIRQIFGKELARIFRDKKMIFSVFLLPVIIMIAILSIINVLASNMENNIESHISNVYMMNSPESFQQILFLTIPYIFSQAPSNDKHEHLNYPGTGNPLCNFPQKAYTYSEQDS